MAGVYCINCRFRDRFGDVDFCERPLSESRNLVNGKHNDTLGVSCFSERYKDRGRFSSRLRCGPSGRFFEERR